MGDSPPAALSRGRHFEGRKYGILKIGRFWQIDVCIAERVGSQLAQQLMIQCTHIGADSMGAIAHTAKKTCGGDALKSAPQGFCLSFLKQ